MMGTPGVPSLMSTPRVDDSGRDISTEPLPDTLVQQTAGHSSHDLTGLDAGPDQGSRKRLWPGESPRPSAQQHLCWPNPTGGLLQDVAPRSTTAYEGAPADSVPGEGKVVPLASPLKHATDAPGPARPVPVKACQTPAHMIHVFSNCATYKQWWCQKVANVVLALDSAGSLLERTAMLVEVEKLIRKSRKIAHTWPLVVGKTMTHAAVMSFSQSNSTKPWKVILQAHRDMLVAARLQPSQHMRLALVVQAHKATLARLQEEQRRLCALSLQMQVGGPNYVESSMVRLQRAGAMLDRQRQLHEQEVGVLVDLHFMMFSSDMLTMEQAARIHGACVEVLPDITILCHLLDSSLPPTLTRHVQQPGPATAPSRVHPPQEGRLAQRPRLAIQLEPEPTPDPPESVEREAACGPALSEPLGREASCPPDLAEAKK